jgi:predicted nuclease of predicted toxin-antitoxin system
MRFLVDAQLPPALAPWLAANGHDAKHVADVGLAAATDKVIWGYSITADAILISKDEDFVQRKALAAPGPNVVGLTGDSVWTEVNPAETFRPLRGVRSVFQLLAA